MKWTKIKNIILCFLLSMNIFLLIFITFTTKNRNAIPDSVVDSTISILEKSGFEIDKEIFPDTYHMLPNYTVRFYSANELSDIFFNQQMAFRTTENTLIATKGMQTLTISGNHFLYESGKSAVKNPDPKTLITKLEKLGINMTGAVFDEKENCFYRMYNKANLFNMSIQVNLDKEGRICYVNANWPKNLSSGERKRISFLESAVKLKEYFPAGGEIKNIELGFSLHSIGGEKYIFSPSWRVMVNNELKIIE